jgi:hypothetical protein
LIYKALLWLRSVMVVYPAPSCLHLACIEGALCVRGRVMVACLLSPIPHHIPPIPRVYI